MKGYEPVPSTEEVEEPLFLRVKEHYQLEDRVHKHRAWHRFVPWIVHTILISLSGILFFLSWRNGPHGESCAKQLSSYSPALEAVEYKMIQFNGTLDHPSEFRGPPSPEVDRAWNVIMANAGMPIRITEQELLKIGKDNHSSTVKYSEKDGGGYMATPEWTHQLHCLNLLRKEIYRDYYASIDEEFGAPTEIYHNHVDHCIEILRQNIMCYADVGLITFDWVEKHRYPYPNFNTWHQCRNLNQLQDWFTDHRVIEISFWDVERSGDQIDLASPP